MADDIKTKRITEYEEITEISDNDWIFVDNVDTGTRKISSRAIKTALSTDAQIAAIQAKGDETLASIPDAYTELSNDVDDLKSALSPVEDVLPKVETVKTSNAQRCVKILDGSFFPVSNTYCGTQYDVSGYDYVIISAHLSSPNNNYASYLFVDENENVLSYKNTSGNGIFTKLGIVVPPGAKYLRLGTLTEDYSSAKVYAYVEINHNTEDYIKPIQDKVDELYTVTNYFDKHNILYANSSMAGDGTISQNNDYDVFNVDLGSVRSSVYMTGAMEIMPFRCYDDSGSAIQAKQLYIRNYPVELELPVGTRYIRFGCRKTYQSYFMVTISPTYEYVPYHDLTVKELNSAQNLWAGKIGDSLGDSFTEQRFFQLYTKKYFGLDKFYIHGVGGTKMSGPANQYGDSMWMDSRINAISTDADFVTVLGGQNDGNVEIGEISKSNEDTSTYAGALNIVIKKLYAHCKQGVCIILCTPFYVPSEGTGGERFAIFAEAVRGIGKLHGLPVADFGGLSTSDENTANLYWESDRTHPIEKFYKEKIAPILISTMENIRPINWDNINNYGKFINSINYLP